MSTRIRWSVVMVKALSGEARSETKLKQIIATKIDAARSTPIDGVRRGRPIADGYGQVISCRMPAEAQEGARHD